MRIKKLRQLAGITQNELAKQLGVNTSAVAKWETKGFTPRAKTLKQLAKIFSVTIDYLLGDDENDAD